MLLQDETTISRYHLMRIFKVFLLICPNSIREVLLNSLARTSGMGEFEPIGKWRYHPHNLLFFSFLLLHQASVQDSRLKMM